MNEAAAGPSTARTEAFSDGVLAIAITLLVLEIGVPEVGPDETLTHALLHLWPKYATFAAMSAGVTKKRGVARTRTS